jgi:hypothetical protein
MDLDFIGFKPIAVFIDPETIDLRFQSNSCTSEDYWWLRQLPGVSTGISPISSRRIVP